MKIRKSKTQELAAARAGISERSARRVERAATLPSQSPRRYWRARVDPFAQVWDTDVVPLLRGAPKLMPVHSIATCDKMTETKVQIGGLNPFADSLPCSRFS